MSYRSSDTLRGELCRDIADRMGLVIGGSLVLSVILFSSWGRAGEQNEGDARELEGPPRLGSEKKEETPSYELSPPISIPLKKSSDAGVGDSNMPEARDSKEGDQAEGDSDGDQTEPPTRPVTASPTVAPAIEARSIGSIDGLETNEQVTYGRVDIETEPENARVYISTQPGIKGDEYGTTPLRVKLVPGSYYITLVHDEYETAIAEVSVSAKKTSWLQLKMTPARSGVSKGIRLAGHILFWPGIVTSVTGISLLLVNDPQKDVRTGKSGGIAAGIGVAMTVLGGIFLGVTYRDNSSYTIPLALSPSDDGHGGQLSFSNTF